MSYTSTFTELRRQLQEARAELASVEKHINDMMGGCVGWYERCGQVLASEEALEGERLYRRLVHTVESLEEEVALL